MQSFLNGFLNNTNQSDWLTNLTNLRAEDFVSSTLDNFQACLTGHHHHYVKSHLRNLDK